MSSGCCLSLCMGIKFRLESAESCQRLEYTSVATCCRHYKMALRAVVTRLNANRPPELAADLPSNGANQSLAAPSPGLSTRATFLYISSSPTPLGAPYFQLSLSTKCASIKCDREESCVGGRHFIAGRGLAGHNLP